MMRAYIHYGDKAGPEPVAVREHGHPQPRLTRDGYTKRGGTPTRFQVYVEGRWRRVYSLCFGTGSTCILRSVSDCTIKVMP